MRTKGDLIFENAYKVLVIWPLFLGSNVSLLPTLLSDAGVEPLQMAIFFCQLVPCQALSSGMPQGAWKLEGRGETFSFVCFLFLSALPQQHSAPWQLLLVPAVQVVLVCCLSNS